MEVSQSDWLAFAVALGAGMLIGVERERRKGAGPRRALAGVRTFTITALCGALAQASGEVLLVGVGALLLLGLAVVGYRRQRSADPGITTEIALFLVYLLGVTAVERPLLAGAVSVVATGLLAARSGLHRFSTRVLTEAELRDLLILAGAALVVLPLVPNGPVAWLGGVNPRRLWTLVVLMLGIQAGGHVALRIAGPGLGLPLSGLAMGFVSSTATFAAMGARSRAHPVSSGASVAGALASNVATPLQLAVVVATVHPPALPAVAWPLVGCLAGAAAAVVVSLRRAPSLVSDRPGDERVLSVLPAIFFAALMSGFTAIATAAHERFGERAAMLAAVVGALADTHAAAASLAALVAGGRIETGQLALPLVLAVTVNTCSKWAAARAGGGGRFARAVLPGLCLTVAGAALPLAWVAPWR